MRLAEVIGVEIIDFSSYKSQRENKKIAFDLSEKETASQILENLNYNHLHTATPIVKVAKSYGFRVFQEDFNVAGKLFVGGFSKDLYDCNQSIIVNSTDPIYRKRIVVASMLGCYFKNGCHHQQNLLFSDILYYEQLYDKYEEFILNILAPTQEFVNQYNTAIHVGLLYQYLYEYLSDFFEVDYEFVKRKIKSLS